MKENDKYILHTDTTTIKSMIESIKAIDKEIMNIYICLKDQKWDQYTDTRLLLLLFLHELNTNTILGFCFQAESLKLSQSKDWWLEKFDHKKDVINSEPDFDQFSRNRNDSFFNNMKDNYIMSFYFEFETRIRHIVRAISSVKTPKNNRKKPYLDGTESFYDISDGFYRNFLDLTSEDYEVIKIYSAIRNTIHNAGFYFPLDAKDKDFKFKGKSYSFKNEAPVNFLDGNFIQELILALVELISLTLKHKKIIEIKEIIDPVSKIEWH